jgi:hypothetical protein
LIPANPLKPNLCLAFHLDPEIRSNNSKNTLMTLGSWTLMEACASQGSERGRESFCVHHGPSVQKLNVFVM